MMYNQLIKGCIMLKHRCGQIDLAQISTDYLRSSVILSVLIGGKDDIV
jgi:hypothetical protein